MSTAPIRAVISLLLLSACGGEAPAKKVAADGKRVYDAQGCALCHLSDGTGTSLGPTLHGKASFWTREKLVEYLKAPVAYAEKDERLREQKKKYPAMPMPPFVKVPEAELGALADFLLGLP